MKFRGSAVIFCLLSLALEAKRPEGNFGGRKQLDIDQLEKDLGKKFSIPFPEKRYDIDYFFKGDLMPLKSGSESLLVGCPFVAGDTISLGFGSGMDGTTFQMTGCLNVSIIDGGKRVIVYLTPEVPGEKAPAFQETPPRHKDESARAFYKKVEKFWLQRAADQKTKITAAQIKSAFKVMAVALKQKPELKIASEETDPTLEDEFQDK